MSGSGLAKTLTRRAFLKKIAVGTGLICTLPLVSACDLVPPTLAPASSASAPNVSPSSSTQAANPGTATSRPTPSAQPTLAPTPTPGEPNGVAEDYFRAWEQGRYADMYAVLSRDARKTISADRFVKRYEDITAGSTISSIKVDYDPVKVQHPAPDEATFEFTVHIQTTRLGEIVETNTLPLYVENGKWWVDWTPTLIFKDLSNRNVVQLFAENPVRGTIFDRQGRPLAVEGTVISVGVVPGRIQDQNQVEQTLRDVLGVEPDVFRKLLEGMQPDWFVPIKDLSVEAAKPFVDRLSSVPGVTTRERKARKYPNGSVGAHVIGYVSSVTAEELQTASGQGYEDGDMVGRAGIEAWGEDLLAGQKGGKLTVVSPSGEVIKTIAERPARPGADIHLTLDIERQKRAEEVLEDKPGSVVVLDARENGILAMASIPSFDPNGFVLGFSTADWEKLANDERHPFQNRPTMSQYPTGSIFKVITMAAGLERGGFSPNSPFFCPGYWTGLGPNLRLACWLPTGHGQTDLFWGLAQSCNIVFYELGKKLDSIDPNILPQFARRFGLGAPTGLVGLRESAGAVPDPAWKQATLQEDWYPGDSVNLAIGQGYLLATPLQMVNTYSAIANGGKLRAPMLVQKVVREGQVVQANTATDKGELPVSAANLNLIRQAMVNVVSDKRGSASYAFKGIKFTLAGKTGSAENVGEKAHAWFVGFAPVESPEVVVMVMVEGSGMGGQQAAPRARKLLEYWFGLADEGAAG